MARLQGRPARAERVEPGAELLGDLSRRHGQASWLDHRLDRLVEHTEQPVDLRHDVVVGVVAMPGPGHHGVEGLVGDTGALSLHPKRGEGLLRVIGVCAGRLQEGQQVLGAVVGLQASLHQGRQRQCGLAQRARDRRLAGRGHGGWPGLGIRGWLRPRATPLEGCLRHDRHRPWP
jgi:hypothetical protein